MDDDDDDDDVSTSKDTRDAVRQSTIQGDHVLIYFIFWGQARLSSAPGLLVGRGSVDRLRASPAHAAFLRRWNLSVYFSLLYQEIAGGAGGRVNQGLVVL